MKVQVSLEPIQHHTTKYTVVEVQLHSFMTVKLGRVISFTSRPLYPQKRGPGTRWIGSWMDPKTGLDAEANKEILSPWWESNPVFQSVVSQYM
jgi:hypothetical protein